MGLLRNGPVLVHDNSILSIQLLIEHQANHKHMSLRGGSHGENKLM